MNALGRGENSEHTFAKNLNGRKGYNGTVNKSPSKKCKQFWKLNSNSIKINQKYDLFAIILFLFSASFFRLTATKIIMFILTIILSGIFIYYFFLFYPILCRKERNYDVVEHSRDTTPTPNTEKL